MKRFLFHPRHESHHYVGVDINPPDETKSVSCGLATGWNPNANDEIFSLTVSGGTVYTGGNFTSIGGQARSRVAALDGSTGLATSWNPNADLYVNTIVVNGSSVYLGGGFTVLNELMSPHFGIVPVDLDS